MRSPPPLASCCGAEPGAAGWFTVVDAERTHGLRTLQDGVTATLDSANLPGGSDHQVRLALDAHESTRVNDGCGSVLHPVIPVGSSGPPPEGSERSDDGGTADDAPQPEVGDTGAD